MILINICNDFTDTPGARYRSEGDFSGEEFRETILGLNAEYESLNKDAKILEGQIAECVKALFGM